MAVKSYTGGRLYGGERKDIHERKLLTETTEFK